MDAKEMGTWLRYDRTTGLLYWVKQTEQYSIKPGDVAGYNCGDYLAVTVQGKGYRQHRVAWLLAHGAWPEGEIDHINGNGKDNRLCNLRDVPKHTNLINQYKHRNGKLFGCSFDKRRSTWKAKIVVNKKEYYLGAYKTEVEAHQAYVRASKQLR